MPILGRIAAKCTPLFFAAIAAALGLAESRPSNLESILASVNSHTERCKLQDIESCDRAADLARKGLALIKPDGTSEADWQKALHEALPAFHSAIALDDALSKRDYKDAELQFTEELKLLSDEETNTRGLSDTLLLAEAYSSPGDAQNLVKAVWFYAHVWNFALLPQKAQIEPKLEYYYKKHHGHLDGLDDIKRQARNSIFPPDSFTIAPGPSVAEMIHAELAQNCGFGCSNLIDKETVLAMGYPEDAEKVWALLRGQHTFVPGIVIAVSASQIQVAVTQDAKDAHVADFLVNMESPLTEAQLKTIQPGFQFNAPPRQSLAATYESYRRIPANGNQPASVEIMLKDGSVVPVQSNTVTAPKPRPAHRD
jgi:hypothetical protein